jgi:hypothetical protein
MFDSPAQTQGRLPCIVVVGVDEVALDQVPMLGKLLFYGGLQLYIPRVLACKFNKELTYRYWQFFIPVSCTMYVPGKPKNYRLQDPGYTPVIISTEFSKF